MKGVLSMIAAVITFFVCMIVVGLFLSMFSLFSNHSSGLFAALNSVGSTITFVISVASAIGVVSLINGDSRKK